MKTNQLYQHHSAVFDYISKLLDHRIPSGEEELLGSKKLKADFVESFAPSSHKTTSNQISSPSEFLIAIVHELKTPLNAVIGFSQVLQEEILNPTSTKECLDYIKDISNAASDLNELIHDLLDVGSAASGKFSINLNTEIDVKDVIRRVVKLNYHYSLKREISIKTEIEEDEMMIRLDIKRMKQILMNLVSNSIKYSPQGSEIKISARNLIENNNKFLEIIVLDNGFGMNPSEIQTAFQKYQTIQNPNSDNVDSFGLGLPITRQLVELQKGTLEAHSQINKGTEIKLKFPYSM